MLSLGWRKTILFDSSKFVRPAARLSNWLGPRCLLTLFLSLPLYSLEFAATAFAQASDDSSHFVSTSQTGAHDGVEIIPEKASDARQANDGDESPTEQANADNSSRDQTLPGFDDQSTASIGPRWDQRFDYFRDTDKARVFTLTSELNFAFDKFLFTLHRDLVQARDPNGFESSASTALSAYRKFSKSFGAGAGFGIIRTINGWSTFVWSLQGDTEIGGFDLGLSLSKAALASTAETIRNHVTQTDLGLSISRDLVENLGTSFEFHRRIFSDRNSGIEIQFSPEYAIDMGKTKLGLGYSFHYFSYARSNVERSLGYYAPQGLISNEGVVNWNFDWNSYYGSIELSLGRSVHTVRTEDPNSFSGSGTIAIGRRLPGGLLLESYIAAEKDALGIPSGWGSFGTGLRLNYPL